MIDINKRAKKTSHLEYKPLLTATLAYTVLTIGVFIMIIPFLWMVLTSFKTFPQTVKIPIVWIPENPNIENYIYVLEKMDFGRAYLNTIFVTIVITICQVFFSSLAAYSFARLKFPGKNAIFFLVLSILMLPFQMIIIPRYLMVNSFGWVENFAAIIIPGIASAWGTFFMRQFFMTLPKEIDEAAKLDGCGYFKIFWKILLPLCSNALIAFTIFTVLWSWNDLLWPMLVTSSNKMRVLSVVLATLQGQYATKNNLMMAAGVITTIPMLIIFIFCQKRMIEGITLTGIKA